jgi:methyl-accepting chemotaxis protein
MKNLKLGMKIGLGFCALILIACALGAMAIISMRGVSDNATRMAEEYIPEVAVANNLERHTMLLMFAMRGFSLTEDQAFRATAREELDAIKGYLDQGRALAETYPKLVKLKAEEAAARDKLGEYERLIDETTELLKSIQGVRDEMDAAAARFVTNASTYQQTQNSALAKEIDLLSTADALKARQEKIDLIYTVVTLTGDVRVKNFKFQALSDPKIMQSGLENFAKIDESIEKLKAVTHKEENLKALATIQEDAQRYKKAMEAMLAAAEKLTSLNERRNVTANELLNESKNMAMAGMDNTKKIADAGVSDLNSAQIAMLVGLALALVIGVILSVTIAKAITRPIFTSVAFAEKVADGNLDDHLDIDQKDEIGNLANSLRKMVANLKERIMEANAKSDEAAKAAEKANAAMREAEKAQAEAVAKSEAMADAAVRLQAVAEITTSASEELSAQIEQSSKGAEQQAQRVAETATAMEEMNATVLEVAKNASDAAEISDGARNKAQEGAAIVGQVVSGIGAVQTQALELKDDMSKLGAQAEGIGQIMAVISDIADQTNLLALNAAIEAARAGEAGRGFAVVADEVRKLAEKTMTATKEVGDAIGGIQDGTRKNMNNVDRSVQTISEATTLANQSGEALNSIVHLVERTSDQVRAIAAASEEQSAASEEINRSIEEVNVISNETAESMTQAAQAVIELARQSQELKTLIDEMRQDDSRKPLALA